MGLAEGKIVKNIILLILMLQYTSVSSQYIQRDSIFNKKVEMAIKQGDAEKLSLLFYTKIDLTLINNSGLYSKHQAKFVLTEFFKDNRPDSFNILNESKNMESNFTVGRLHTTHQHFRVCYLTKVINNKLYIYQLRIEK